MSLFQKIDDDLLAALKSGDQAKKETLRFLKSSLKNTLIDQGKNELSDDEVQATIQKEAKKRRESILAYEQAGRPELAETEQEELKILEEYLPKRLDEAEIKKIVADYLKDNPTDVAGIGQAMGRLSQELRGKADLGEVAKILREQIGQ